MDKIKFLKNNNNVYELNILNISENIVQLSFSSSIPSTDILLGGFYIINENNEKNMSSDYYHGYNTVYKVVDENTIMLSNDGSVYVEPETPDIPDEPETPLEPYIPTLEDVKNSKIAELSAICNQNILNGVDVEINDVVEHFSYTEEDQVNLKEIFDLCLQTNTDMYYHADNESCKLYTVEQIINIYTTATTNKMHNITYFNQLKMYIETLEDKETVNAVTFGQELTGDYLNTYNSSMQQAQLLLEKLLSQRQAILSGSDE